MLERLQEEADQYAADLYLWGERHNLGDLVAGAQDVDHVAVKAADTAEFEAILAEVEPQCEQLSYIEMHNRRLATAKLAQPVVCGLLGKTVWLEIMEPRPEKAGKDLTGFEHIEIFAEGGLSVVRKRLVEVGMRPDEGFEDYDNGNHKALVIPINKAGQEVKFTDSHLGELVEAEEGVVWLKRAA